MIDATGVARRVSKTALLPLGWAGRRRPGDVVVLLYHRIGPGTAEIELPPELFASQIGHLAARERVLTLDQAVAGGGSGGVVVTFDDGTRDFAETVVPLAVENRVPVHLYLATGLVADGSAGGLTWSQLNDAVSTGLVTVGSHTHSHADLSRAEEREAEEEMRRSKELIEDRLGRSCEHFAYPWAVGSPGADRAARRLFRTAALDAWRTNRRGQIDPYRLGRVPVLRSDGRFFFRRKVGGQLDVEVWVYRALGRGPWGRAEK
jgi:peptidoglycan/xylan/chitin deacetylase (PgdA/CDA1 family)